MVGKARQGKTTGDEHDGGVAYALRILQPVLALGCRDLVGDLRQDLAAFGVVEAIRRRDTPFLFEWMLAKFQLQGLSDANALGFTARHGAVGWHDLASCLGTVAQTRASASSPRCPRLSSYWSFAGCGYEKSARCCADAGRIDRCLLPRLPLRNGRLSQGAVAFFLFVRDVCDGDLIEWIDDRLASADIQPRQQAFPGSGMHLMSPSPNALRPRFTRSQGANASMRAHLGAGVGDQVPGQGDPSARAATMREALLDPMSEIFGVGRKVLSMVLADLLLAADPSRERWITTGESMIAIDTLVHNFLHRTGILRQFDAHHPYGDRCYGANGCAEIIEQIAQDIDARRYNPAFPAVFPRYVQHAIWSFCAGGGWNICNGNRIDDSAACLQRTCSAFATCARQPLRG